MTQGTMTGGPLPLWRTPTAIVIAGCVIAMIAFGVRSSFGLFLDPSPTRMIGPDRLLVLPSRSKT